MIKASDLLTEKTLMPGDPGTQKWIKKFGDQLICIRYKYDRIRKKKLKTVELIVEEKESKKLKTQIPWNKIVKVKIKYGEINLARLVKQAGGKWNTKEKVWEICYGEVKSLGLTHRLVR